jgi:MFS family permease
VGVILALAPALSVAVLHIPLQKAAWYLIFPAGFGMVVGVGSISALSRKWSKVRILEVCLVVAAVSLTLLGLTGELYRSDDVPYTTIGIIVAALVFTLGMLNAIISATAQTLLQEKSSDEIRGKIFGSLNMMINIASTVPIFVAGILADLISVTKVITLIGAAVAIYALLQLRMLRREPAAQV